MIIANIQKNEKTLYEADNFNDWMIQPNAKRVDLIDAIKLILIASINFNEIKSGQGKRLLKNYDLSCDV